MINIFYGPDSEFKTKIPSEEQYKSLTQLVSEYDIESKSYRIYDASSAQDSNKPRPIVEFLVCYSNEYASLSNAGLSNLLGVLNSYEIHSMYFQNPPEIIKNQLKNCYPIESINEDGYNYKIIQQECLRQFMDKFDEKIKGQSDAKEKLGLNLYQISKQYNNDKPIVLMLYGPPGVGKTETAKFLSQILGEELFRVQFSMYQSGAFADYIFGSDISTPSLARDLLERQSNVILFDEFDKCGSLFYSAFYQMFDEGVFKDKNYSVDLKNSVILCTSNFLSESDTMKAMGYPIASRFDGFVQFKELSEEVVKELLIKKYNDLVDSMEKSDKETLSKLRILEHLLQNAKLLKNTREIDRVLKEFVYHRLLDNFCKSNNIKTSMLLPL